MAMKVTVETRSVRVSTTIRLEGAETITLYNGERVLPDSLTILYATGQRGEPTWTLRTWKIKKDGSPGGQSKEIGSYAFTAFGREGGIPQWLTELLETHRPKTLDI